MLFKKIPDYIGLFIGGRSNNNHNFFNNSWKGTKKTLIIM